MDLHILDAMPDAVIVCDRSGTIRYANRTVENLLGYAARELVGSPLGVLVPHAQRGTHAIAADAYFAAPHPRPMGLGHALAALRKDGHALPVDISLAPLRLGCEDLVVASIRDISERRALEERERDLRNAQLEIRRRDEVLAIASHELKTPVGSMQLQARLLERVAMDTASELSAIHERTGVAATELESIRERIAKLGSYSRRLGRLVEHLLDSAHARRGELPLRVEDADLTELTREAVASIGHEIERSGSSLTVHADRPVRGRWDPIRIEQVIANLLLNAAKFGEGKPIRLSVSGEDGGACIVVEDEGPGIAPEDQSRIFQEFERAVAGDGAIGLGLGLYISKQIVRAHGGDISVRSAPGAGATFTVNLPRATTH